MTTINGEQIISPYFRVQNGAQIDIHVKVLPRDNQPRELTIKSGVPESEVDRLVEDMNASLDHEYEQSQLHG